MALLILIDLADPMARHTSDTTQTENNNNNNNENIVTPNAASPLKIPNGGIEVKQVNRLPTQQPAETFIQVHNVHEDSRSENHSPPQSNIPLNGNYHRSDEVDFVQTKILPTPEQPVFEKVLLPEKRRPEKHNIPNPRENTSQTEFVTERIRDQRQTASYDQNNFSHQDQYHNLDIRHHPHQNYGYVKDNMVATRKLPVNHHHIPHHHIPQQRYDHRPLMVIRDYSNSKANMSYEQRITSPSTSSSYRRSSHCPSNKSKKSHCRSHCSSDDDDNVSAIQPGFVANAAKIWDNRAKRDFNTVV